MPLWLISSAILCVIVYNLPPCKRTHSGLIVFPAITTQALQPARCLNLCIPKWICYHSTTIFIHPLMSGKWGMCVAIGEIYRKQRYSVIRRETEAMISLSKKLGFLNKFCGLTREYLCFHILFANYSNQFPTKNWWENCLLILKLSIFLFKLLTGMGCLLFERAWVEMTVLPRFLLCHLRPVVCWGRLWEYPVVCLPKLTTKCVNFNGKINFPSQQSSLRLGGFKTVGKSADDSDIGSFKLNCRSSLPYLLYKSQNFNSAISIITSIITQSHSYS